MSTQHDYENDETLALWFTPQAIRDHFEGDSDSRSEWVANATDEQLVSVGRNCLSADSLYSVFHDVLKGFVNEEMGGDWEDA